LVEVPAAPMTGRRNHNKISNRRGLHVSGLDQLRSGHGHTPSRQDIAQKFLDTSYHRFPVMEGGRLVGQISRYDILLAIEDLW